MSKWEQIDFKDIREGDTIKGIARKGGVVNMGVVVNVGPVSVRAEYGGIIAGKSDHAIYRRKPKKPAFVPLDVPEEGQWIEATLRSGEVREFQVNTVTDEGSFWSINEQSTDVTLPKEGDRSPIADDILSWRPIDPPTPPEPEGFGHVGYVTEAGGEVWDVARDQRGNYDFTRRGDGYQRLSCRWSDVLALGAFTAVER